MRDRRWVLSAAIVLLAAAVAWLFFGRQLFHPAEDPAAVEEESFPLTLIDDEGVSMTLANKPARIVSLAPHITETLFAIGSSDAVIAVGAGETYPPEATAIPALVEADGFTPSERSILAAKPDLVVASGFTKAPWKDRLRTQVPVFTLEATGIEDALSDISKVGKASGRSATAAALVARMRRSLPEARTGTKTVMIETFPEPLQVAGTSGYMEDLVARAGGRLLAPSPGQSVPAKVETLSSLDPRLYVLGSSSGTKEALASRKGFASVPAVRDGRVIVIDDGLLFRPGPRLIEAVRLLNGALS